MRVPSPDLGLGSSLVVRVSSNLWSLLMTKWLPRVTFCPSSITTFCTSRWQNKYGAAVKVRNFKNVTTLNQVWPCSYDSCKDTIGWVWISGVSKAEREIWFIGIPLAKIKLFNITFVHCYCCSAYYYILIRQRITGW